MVLWRSRESNLRPLVYKASHPFAGSHLRPPKKYTHHGMRRYYFVISLNKKRFKIIIYITKKIKYDG